MENPAAANQHFSLGRFALLLGALVAVFYWPVLAGMESFYFRDFGTFGYALAHYHRECFWRGEIPLWTPLSACGLPYLAQWNTLTCYPLSALYLLLPLPWSLNLFCLLHLFLAGLGMRQLALRWTGDSGAAALAGVAFALNGLLVNALMWPNNIAAFGWMPWVVLAVARARAEGGRRLWPAMVCGAMQMLAGAPEVILCTWLVNLALLVAEVLAGGRANARASALQAMRLAGVGAMIAALCAVQLLPFLDLLRLSQRGGEFDGGWWAIPRWGWANLVLPIFQCHTTVAGPHFQAGQYWTASYYAGAGVIALAAWAVILRREARVLALALLAGFGLLMALGPDGYFYPAALQLCPPLKIMRFPVKFIIAPVFALPLLAACGAAQWRAGASRRSLAYLLTALAALLGVLLAYGALHPAPGVAVGEFLSDSVVRLVFLAGFAALLFWGASAGARPAAAAWILPLLAGWLGLDLLWHGRTVTPTVSPAVLAPRLVTEAEMNPRPQPGSGRAFLARDTHDLLNQRMLPDRAQDVLGRRLGLVSNFSLLENLPVADGFYSLYLPQQFTVWSTLFSARTNAFPEGLADAAGITQISDAHQALAWKPRPSALAFVSAGQAPEFLPEQGALARMVQPDFNPHRTVMLPPEARAAFPTNAGTTAIGPVEFSAHRLAFAVRGEQPAAVVLAQTWHPNWRAKVDGAPVPLWRANYAFQALAVPAGAHRVTVEYQDQAFRLGAGLSGAAWLGLAAGWLWARRRKLP